MSCATRIAIEAVGRDKALEAVNFSSDPNYWLQIKGIGPATAYFLSREFEDVGGDPRYSWGTGGITAKGPKLTRAQAIEKYPNFNFNKIEDSWSNRHLFSGKALHTLRSELAVNQMRAILDLHKVTGSETPNQLLSGIRNMCYDLEIALIKLKNRGQGDFSKDSIKQLIKTMSKYT